MVAWAATSRIAASEAKAMSLQSKPAAFVYMWIARMMMDVMSQRLNRASI